MRRAVAPTVASSSIRSIRSSISPWAGLVGWRPRHESRVARACDISPYYAQGIYARAWAEAMAGRTTEARRHVDLAMRLSPLDPLHYAMLATRGLTHMIAGGDADAAYWAERGARSPGAHVLIAMIAAAAHVLTGDEARAGFWAANARERNGVLSRADFFRAFPMKSNPARARRAGARAGGIPLGPCVGPRLARTAQPRRESRCGHGPRGAINVGPRLAEPRVRPARHRVRARAPRSMPIPGTEISNLLSRDAGDKVRDPDRAWDAPERDEREGRLFLPGVRTRFRRPDGAAAGGRSCRWSALVGCRGGCVRAARRGRVVPRENRADRKYPPLPAP